MSVTVQQLRNLGNDVGVLLPNLDEECERLLALALNDVEVHCGVRFTSDMLGALSDEQQAALDQATLRQACWLRELESEWLGPSDVAGIAAAGITFGRDARPRFSPAATEALAYWGLLTRSGTVAPDLAPAEPPLPWWLWL